ncbi:hypothetical protein KAFR_0J00310 [Kazachstania africana CBS 2517]|uniref:XPG-I domain-containing protein n=1 Tax=Kazachstania africana (strain ATCC 22294 / BCRC 22015 / CBS 2517 / CECT 1963 / NBRC 1671 / NRRL Y-8276) TaxID=1071382 RepID=H2B0E9_KAZAF|nr:hypothetical protein KAFR_0J00310 [Kazachstania africana CBS 2517]CCF60099.1 hypothetical protein KAFR_0J00310 [Kazachstania africana CBS 2517]
MGVPQIWELVKQTNSVERVTFKTIIPRVKVAVDAYHILFECGFFNESANYGKAYLNLISRLRELISLNAFFLLIFDGHVKPTKVRNAGYGGDYEPEFMNLIKSLLNLFHISYVTAIGEGEAYCCWVTKQLNDQLDYVWSNDSDVLLFGGMKVLKNYSRFVNDIGVTNVNGDTNEKNHENLITFVDYDELTRKHKMLNRERLLFYSVLLGADYNQGVKGLGKDKCLKIVQLTNPDFAMRFYNIFSNTRSNDSTKTSKYIKFQKDLFAYCQKNSVELFGRNYSKTLLSAERDNFEGWPAVEIVSYYFHPLLDTNFDKRLLCKEMFSNIKDSKIYEKIDFFELKTCLEQLKMPSITDFDKWFHSLVHEMFLVKFLVNEEGKMDFMKNKLLKITEEKVNYVNNNIKLAIPYWKVRYNTFLPGVSPSQKVSKNRSPSPTRSPSKRQIDIYEYKFSMWVPKVCIPPTHSLVRDFQRRQDEERKEEEKNKKLKLSRISPKKRLSNYKQKNNLDAFLKKHATPMKRELQSLKLQPAPPLQSIKRRLFVEADEEDEEQNDTEEEDSLMILEENIITNNPLSNRSPQKRPMGPFEKPTVSPLSKGIPLLKKQCSFKEDDNASEEPLVTVSDATVDPNVSLESSQQQQQPGNIYGELTSNAIDFTSEYLNDTESSSMNTGSDWEFD